MKKVPILIVQYGSQYTQLIARRIREMGVYAEVVGHAEALHAIKEYRVKGLILSGGPNSVYDKGAPQIEKEIFELGVPILGICYGMHLIGKHFGSRIKSAHKKEYGKSDLLLQTRTHSLVTQIPKRSSIWASHGDELQNIPKDFKVLALSNKQSCIAIIAHKQKAIYGVQFHPEVTQTEYGGKLLSNFLFSICGCKKNVESY